MIVMDVMCYVVMYNYYNNKFGVYSDKTKLTTLSVATRSVFIKKKKKNVVHNNIKHNNISFIMFNRILKKLYNFSLLSSVYAVRYNSI